MTLLQEQGLEQGLEHRHDHPANAARATMPRPLTLAAVAVLLRAHPRFGLAAQALPRLAHRSACVVIDMSRLALVKMRAALDPRRCTSRPVAVGYLCARSFTIMSSMLWSYPCAQAVTVSPPLRWRV